MGSWLSFKTRMSNYGKGIFPAIQGHRLLSTKGHSRCRLKLCSHSRAPVQFSTLYVTWELLVPVSEHNTFFVPDLRHQCLGTKCEYSLLRHVFISGNISVTSSCLATGVAMNSFIPTKPRGMRDLDVSN